MLHLRLSTPADATDDVVATLQDQPACAHLAVLRGASVEPVGDVVLCDIVREGASPVLEALRPFDLASRGAIIVESIDVCVSARADAAEKLAPGLGADAVIWEQIEERTGEETYLSATYLAFMAVAMMIAAVGIMLDSPILIVGAMVVGPDFGPVAAICVGIVRQRWRMVWRAAVALGVGFLVGALAAMLLVMTLSGIGIFEHSQFEAARPMTRFISEPDFLSGVVAVVAGIAGTLSLTSAKSGALIGVLISVTTIPAASNLATGLAYGQFHDVDGSLVQLAINIGAMIIAGTLTLVAQRLFQRWWVDPETRRRQARRRALRRRVQPS